MQCKHDTTKVRRSHVYNPQQLKPSSKITRKYSTKLGYAYIYQTICNLSISVRNSLHQHKS